MLRKLRTAAAVVRCGGVRYASIFAARRCMAAATPLAKVSGSGLCETLHRGLSRLDSVLAEIEYGRGIAEPWAVTARQFTTADNKRWWNDHNWSNCGEEWTPGGAWKAAVVDEFLFPFIPSGGVILEIGPGAGRWTEVMQPMASHLYVLDVAARPLAICRDRFTTATNIEYLLGDGRSIPLEARSVDSIWSYDVFVHVNSCDAQAYFAEFARVLRAGGHAIVHHPGTASSADRARLHRSDLTDTMIREFAAAGDLDVILQTSELVNDGDTLTVLRKH